MLADFKLGLKLLKYGFKVKQQCFFLVAILTAGIIVEIVTKGTNMIGGFYILLIGMFAQQMIISLNVSSLIQSSKIKRATQTTMPVIVSFILYFALMIFLSIEKTIMVNMYPETAIELKTTFVTVAIIFFFTLIYSGFAYKFYVFSMVFLMTVVLGVTTALTVFSGIGAMDFIADIKMPVLIAFAFVLLFIGIGIQYALSVLTYKREISPLVFKGMMKRMS